MTIAEWVAAHPARVVSELPKDVLFEADNQWDVELARDRREIASGHGGLEVVQYGETFYLTWRE